LDIGHPTFHHTPSFVLPHPIHHVVYYLHVGTFPLSLRRGGRTSDLKKLSRRGWGEVKERAKDERMGVIVRVGMG
jgi:hypothetical protein